MSGGESGRADCWLGKGEKGSASPFSTPSRVMGYCNNQTTAREGWEQLGKCRVASGSKSSYSGPNYVMGGTGRVEEKEASWSLIPSLIHPGPDPSCSTHLEMSDVKCGYIHKHSLAPTIQWVLAVAREAAASANTSTRGGLSSGLGNIGLHS